MYVALTTHTQLYMYTCTYKHTCTCTYMNYCSRDTSIIMYMIYMYVDKLMYTAVKTMCFLDFGRALGVPQTKLKFRY